MAAPIRRTATAVITPILFSYRSGHFRSSLAARAVRNDGAPLPWYTYPAIDFLQHRPWAGKQVLEFGAGQSTLWWARHAAHVTALEGDPHWYRTIAGTMPGNVDLHLVPMTSGEACVTEARRIVLAQPRRYDVIVIDGLYRCELVPLARELMAADGLIICDNAEGYGFQEALRDSGLQRVDFYGHAPGVVLPHATSIYFTAGAFAVGANHPIVSPATGDAAR